MEALLEVCKRNQSSYKLKGEEKVMIKFCMALLLSLFCYSSLATSYTRGDQTCGDFERTKRYATITAVDSLDVRLVYAMCLIVKGEAEGNRSEVNKGLSILYPLADNADNVAAAIFLADYHATGGTFRTLAGENLHTAMKYFLKTLAIIESFGNNYPTLEYLLWESDYSMELNAYLLVPELYLRMYLLGSIGDFSSRVLKSPSYKGDRDLKTHPEHNRSMVYYLERTIEHAGRCRYLRKKDHFNKDIYPRYVQICGIYQETAIILKELELKRYEIMSQSNCQDLTWEENPTCPEITLANNEVGDILDEMYKKVSDILDTLPNKMASRM